MLISFYKDQIHNRLATLSQICFSIRGTPVATIIKLFWGVIYTTSSVFPYDFDWGYVNSDAITSKKSYNIGQRALEKGFKLWNK